MPLLERVFLEAVGDVRVPVFAGEELALQRQVQGNGRCDGGLEHQQARGEVLVRQHRLRHGKGDGHVLALVEQAHVFIPRGGEQARDVRLLDVQVQAVALLGLVELVLLRLGGHDADRLRLPLRVLQAEVALGHAAQRLVALEHLQPAHDGRIDHDLPAQIVQRQAALHQEGVIVRLRDPQAAHDPRAEHRAVDQAALVVHIGLFQFKVAHGQELAVEVAVALQRKNACVLQFCSPPITVSY